ncbi:MAG: hypothetical protein K0R39_4141 [Symbiobacteriaceae bacterium]|jgi:hypothetical protein|nr:hypothetical protein [Symbiobacteriaceae bacterium]
MELYAIVQPLVLTIDAYRDTSGEDDPEELALLQLEDKDRASRIAGVLQELYDIDSNLADPRADEGLDEQVGTIEGLHELRAIAAAVHGKSPDDYYEMRVMAGFEFNHLINHDDEGGYYLPVDFMQPFFIKETDDEDAEYISVGSAAALLRELDALEPVLLAQFPVQMAALPPADEPLSTFDGPVPIWHSLRRFCRSAVDMDLPFRFG